jgi:hypothetical protein
MWQLDAVSRLRADAVAGALSIYRIVLFTDALKSSLQNPTLRTKRIILFSADEPDKKANAALLMALYAVSGRLSRTELS